MERLREDSLDRRGWPGREAGMATWRKRMGWDLELTRPFHGLGVADVAQEAVQLRNAVTDADTTIDADTIIDAEFDRRGRGRGPMPTHDGRYLDPRPATTTITISSTTPITIPITSSIS